MPPLHELTLTQWLEALSRRDPTPAGGALALATLAGTAALSAKVARLLRREAGGFESRARDFLVWAEEDGECYARAARGSPAERRESIEAGLRHLEAALGLLVDLAALLAAAGDSPVAADVVAAARLGRASARTVLVNLAVNLGVWAGSVDEEACLAERLADVRARLEEA